MNIKGLNVAFFFDRKALTIFSVPFVLHKHIECMGGRQSNNWNTTTTSFHLNMGSLEKLSYHFVFQLPSQCLEITPNSPSE